MTRRFSGVAKLGPVDASRFGPLPGSYLSVPTPECNVGVWGGELTRSDGQIAIRGPLPPGKWEDRSVRKYLYRTKLWDLALRARPNAELIGTCRVTEDPDREPYYVFTHGVACKQKYVRAMVAAGAKQWSHHEFPQQSDDPEVRSLAIIGIDDTGRVVGVAMAYHYMIPQTRVRRLQ